MRKILSGLLVGALLMTAFFLLGEKIALDFFTYREGVLGYPQTLNPIQITAGSLEADVAYLLHGGLFHYDTDGKLMPDAVTGFQVSPEGQTYNFALDPDRRFHDGEAVSSDDVEYTLGKLLDYPDSPYQSGLAGAVFEKVDRLRFRLKLTERNRLFLHSLTFGLLPSRRPYENSDPPIGLGPFRLIEIKKDEGGQRITKITLEKYDPAFLPLPFLTRVLQGERGFRRLAFRYFEKSEQLYAAYQTGEIMGFIKPPGEPSFPFSLPSDRLDWIVSGRLMVLFINLNQEALRSNEFRHELASVIDREKLATQVFKKEASPLFTFFPSGLNPEIDNLKDEPKKTISGQYGAAYTLVFPDSAFLVQTAQWLKDELAPLGLSLNLRPLTGSAPLSQELENSPFDFFLTFLDRGRHLDLFALFHSNQTPPLGLNFTGFSHPRADRAIEEYRQSQKEEEQKTHLVNLAKVLFLEKPALPLLSPRLIYFKRPRIRALFQSAIFFREERFARFSEWRL